MTDAEMLAMLETDLEIVTDYMDSTAKTAKETELTQYINAAKVYITREGVTLDLADPGENTVLTVTIRSGEGRFFLLA